MNINSIKLLYGNSAKTLGYGCYTLTDKNGKTTLYKDGTKQFIELGKCECINNAEDNTIYSAGNEYYIIKLSTLKVLKINTYSNLIHYINGYWVNLIIKEYTYCCNIINFDLDIEFKSVEHEGDIFNIWGQEKFRKKDRIGFNALIRYSRVPKGIKYIADKTQQGWKESIVQIELRNNRWIETKQLLE